jgi:hypothetical protein
VNTPSLCRGVVTGGWLVGGNSTGVAMWAEQRRGIWGRGEEGVDRRVLAVSDCGLCTVMGWHAGSRADRGRGTIEVGQHGGKRPAKPFPF